MLRTASDWQLRQADERENRDYYLKSLESCNHSLVLSDPKLSAL